MFTTCLLAELASYRKELATSNNEDFLQKKIYTCPRKPINNADQEKFSRGGGPRT